MTADEATTRLKAMTAWDVDPTLSPAEIATLLTMSKIADVYGLFPTDSGWTPTFNLNIGAAEGWRWKAAKADGLDGGNVVSAKVGDVSETYATPRERFMANAQMYQRKINGTIQTGQFANPLMPTEILP